MKAKDHANATREKQGFTLVETLMALLIITMLTAIVANTLPVAKNSYEKVRDASNAQVALSTTTAALRNELGLATDVREDGGKWYYQDASGGWARIFADGEEHPNLDPDDVKPSLQKQYYQETGSGFSELTGAVSTSLVPQKALPDGLKVTCTNIAYDESKGVWTIFGLTVYKDSENKTKKELAWIGKTDDHSEKQNYTVRSVVGEV